MEQIFSQDYTVYAFGGGTLLYRLVAILNSQDTGAKKSNISLKVYAKRGTTAYAGNSYVKMSVSGKTSVVLTETEYVEPTKITRNDYTAFTELSSLSYTADYSHNNDGTLSVTFNVLIDPTTSTNQYVPKLTTISTGDITVPAIDVGAAYSILDNIGDMSVAGNFAFTFTPSANAHHHLIVVRDGATTLVSVANYNSGDVITIPTNKVLSQLSDISGLNKTYNVLLTTYNESNQVLGNDQKSFTALLTSIWTTDDNVRKPGIPWINDNGTYKKGIMWINDDGTWKRGAAK